MFPGDFRCNNCKRETPTNKRTSVRTTTQPPHLQPSGCRAWATCPTLLPALGQPAGAMEPGPFPTKPVAGMCRLFLPAAGSGLRFDSRPLMCPWWRQAWFSLTPARYAAQPYPRQAFASQALSATGPQGSSSDHLVFFLILFCRNLMVFYCSAKMSRSHVYNVF